MAGAADCLAPIPSPHTLEPRLTCSTRPGSLAPLRKTAATRDGRDRSGVDPGVPASRFAWEPEPWPTSAVLSQPRAPSFGPGYESMTLYLHLPIV